MPRFLTKAGAAAFQEYDAEFQEPEEETTPDLFRKTIPDLETQPRCIMCGQSTDIPGAFDRGLKYALDMVRKRLLMAYPEPTVSYIMTWIEADPELGLVR